MTTRHTVYIVGAAICLLNACTGKQVADNGPTVSKTIVRSFDQAVVAALPASWPQDPALVERGGNSVRATFLPAVQAPDKKEKITVTIRESDGPEDEYALYSENPEAPCAAGNLSEKVLGEDASGLLTLAYCGRLEKPGNPAGRVTLSKTIEKNGEIYDIARVWTGAAFNAAAADVEILPVARPMLHKGRDLIENESAVCTRRAPEDYCSHHAYLFKTKKISIQKAEK